MLSPYRSFFPMALCATGAFFGMFLLPSLARAATHYVSRDSGSDTNDGSQSAPWQSIQFAANAVVPGDTVIVGEGTYPELVTINQSGTSEGARITFLSATLHNAQVIGFRVRGDYVTIDGFKVEPDMATIHGIAIQGRSHVRISHCLVQECPGSGIRVEPGPAPAYALGESVEILDNTIHRVTQAGIGLAANSSLVQGNLITEVMQYHPKGPIPNFTGADADGFRIHGDGNIIRSNVVRNLAEPGDPANPSDPNHAANVDPHPDCVQSFGAGATPVMTNTLFEGNHCQSRNKGSHGILVEPKTGNTCHHLNVVNNIFEFRDMGIVLVEGTFHTVSIYNNLFKVQANDTPWGVALHMRDVADYAVVNNLMIDSDDQHRKIEGGNGLVDYNLVWNSDGSTPGGIPAIQPHEVWGPAANPLFVLYSPNPGGDYRLQLGSAAIDKGTALPSVTTDFAGNPRPYGAAYDVGPFEYSGLVVPSDAGAEADAPPPSHDDAATTDADAASGADTGTPIQDAATDAANTPQPAESASDGGCGCSVPGTTSSTGGFGVALLGVAAAAWKRRRRGGPGLLSLFSICLASIGIGCGGDDASPSSPAPQPDASDSSTSDADAAVQANDSATGPDVATTDAEDAGTDSLVDAPTPCDECPPAAFGATTIALWKFNRSAALSVNFDDSTPGQAEIGVPAMADAGLTGTWFINPEGTGYDKTVFEVYAPQHAQELANHTLHHQGATTCDAAYAEIMGAATIIRNAYPPTRSPLLAFNPGGGTESTWAGIDWSSCSDGQTYVDLDDYLAKHDHVWRKHSSGIYPATPFGDATVLPNPHTPIGSMVDLLRIKFGVAPHDTEQPVWQGTWGNIHFHGICKETDADGNANPNCVCATPNEAATCREHLGVNSGAVARGEFLELVNFLATDAFFSTDVWISGFASVYKYRTLRAGATAAVLSVSGDEATVQVSSTLEPAIYDEPITLLTDLPPGWTSCTAAQAGESLECVVVDGKARYEARIGQVLLSGN